MSGHWYEYPTVLCWSIVYVLVDLQPQVKSFRALIRTVSFYLFLFIFTALDCLAYALVRHEYGAKLQEHVAEMSFFLAAFISTFGCITLLQSFSIKLAEKKLFDLAGIFDGYRATVVEHARAKFADITFEDTEQLAENLRRSYAQDGDYKQLRTDYEYVMAGNNEGQHLDKAAIQEALENLDSRSTKKADVVRKLTRDMAVAGPGVVKGILKTKRKA